MTNERVNIEEIASKSKEFELYLFGDTGSLYTIDLPIHFRYQLAGKQRLFYILYRHNIITTLHVKISLYALDL